MVIAHSLTFTVPFPCLINLHGVHVVVSVHFTLFQTAAGMDYIAPNRTTLTFSMDNSDQPQCVTINITDDNYLEYTESFIVSLATLDDDVKLLYNESTITILDNDGKKYELVS